MLSEFPTVIVFAYNRPQLLEKTLNSLGNCIGVKNFKIKIICDGPKDKSTHSSVEQTRKVASKWAKGFSCEIQERDVNFGLARSIIKGVSDVLENESSVIVLEDDLLFNQYFLEYMASALFQYSNRAEIHSVGGYCYPRNRFSIPKNYNDDIFLSRRMFSWGWGTWGRIWRQVDWSLNTLGKDLVDTCLLERLRLAGGDLEEMLLLQKLGRIDSWAVRFCFDMAKNDRLAVQPVKSLVQNIGFGSAATHCRTIDPRYDVTIDHTWRPLVSDRLGNEDAEIRTLVSEYIAARPYETLLKEFLELEHA